MSFFVSMAGLSPQFRSPPDAAEVEEVVTEEAAVHAPAGTSAQITPLVREGETVAEGAALVCLRDAPDVRFVAPIAGIVAKLSLLPGRKLSEIVIFRKPGNEAERHDLGDAGAVDGLRRLMQRAGFWPWLRRRPFGGMPAQDESPAAIIVMASDTRPFAPDPRRALAGREEDLARGLTALSQLSEGPVLFCQQAGPWLYDRRAAGDRVQRIDCGPRHPQGSAGWRIHQHFPAGIGVPVWDAHAEDVAALGALLNTGVLSMPRLVRIAGAGLRESKTVRTHPGADLRQLTQRIVAPGPHELISGSPLDGRVARWLAPRHRQVTVLPRQSAQRRRHWLVAALTRPTGAGPVIPTAALNQAFGAGLPATPFIRALSAGDDEAAMRLGILSLLEEDVALADFVLSEGGRIIAQLRGMLDRIRAEFDA